LKDGPDVVEGMNVEWITWSDVGLEIDESRNRTDNGLDSTNKQVFLLRNRKELLLAH